MKAITEPSPEARPTRQAGGKIKSLLIRLGGAIPEQVRSDYKIPLLTTYWERPGSRPLPIAQWTAEAGFELLDGYVGMDLKLSREAMQSSLNSRS